MSAFTDYLNSLGPFQPQVAHTLMQTNPGTDTFSQSNPLPSNSTNFAVSPGNLFPSTSSASADPFNEFAAALGTPSSQGTPQDVVAAQNSSNPVDLSTIFGTPPDQLAASAIPTDATSSTTPSATSPTAAASPAAAANSQFFPNLFTDIGAFFARWGLVLLAIVLIGGAAWAMMHGGIKANVRRAMA